MDSHNSEETNVITRDNITVYQTFTEERFNIPTVVLRLESEKNAPVRIQLNETVPEDIESKHIGFHPEYNADAWSVIDDTLLFEAELEANEDMTTMFATRNLSVEHSDSLFESIEIEQINVRTQAENVKNSVESTNETSADTPTDDQNEFAHSSAPVSPTESDARYSEDSDSNLESSYSETQSSESSSTTRSQQDDNTERESSNDNRTNPSTEDIDKRPDAEPTDAGKQGEKRPDQSDTAVETPSLSDTNNGDTADDQTAPHPDTQMNTADATVNERADDTVDESEEHNKTTDKSPLSALATENLIQEIQRRANAGELSSETQSQLRTLSVQQSDENLVSIDQRLAHLQQRMGDVEAFSESVEAVHTEYGSPIEAFEKIDDDLSALSDEIDEVNERVSQQSDDVDSRLDKLEENMENITTTISSIEEDVTAIETEQDNLSSRLSELANWRKRLMQSLTSLTDDSS